VSSTIERIKAEGGTVLVEATARIDQIEGVRKARALGFRRIAVSVAGFQARAVSEMRRFEAST
jgi:hypothetical protein